MRPRFVATALVGSLLALPACTPPKPQAARQLEALDYGRARNWMCRPGLRVNPCRSVDLAATVMKPDGSEDEVPGPRVAEAPPYDCFYLYPTVSLGWSVGNASIASLPSRVRDPLVAQAARFRGQCRLFVPLYRQITLVTYMTEPDVDRYLERAYADVEAAFRYYLAHDGGDRPFVILGHSQGAHMGRRLVDRVVAPDPALRKRLIAALLIGGDVLTRPGTHVATNAGNLPLCSSAHASGCVIAYRTYLRGRPPPAGSAPTFPDGVPEGMVPACVNPADLGGGAARFAASYFPTHARQRAFDPWQREHPPGHEPTVLYRDFYAGECLRDRKGFPYLAVWPDPPAGDERENRLPFRSREYSPGILGLHVLDYDFALGDLMRAVETMAEAMRDPQSGLPGG